MDRVRTAKYVAVWGLSALLAAVFLIAGIPKLSGGENNWVRSFALWGYPVWFRMIVGLVETVGGLLLLVPRLSALAAVALALEMMGATFTQLARGEPGAYVPALLVPLLLFVAWTNRPEAMRKPHQQRPPKAHPIIREGLIAGTLGATGVAVWFMVVDMIAGRPLFTPTLLGRLLFSIFGAVPASESALVHVLAYTIFHYLAFVAVGALAALVVHVAEREPQILAGFFILFVVFEIGFHAFVALIQEGTALGALAWYQVMAGNLIAALLMGTYLWRAHPALRAEFAHALDGTE